MKHLLIGLFLLLVSDTYAQSCNCQVQGTVYDFHDGKPMAGATVYLTSKKRYTVSDANGKFTFKNCCPGTDTICVNHLGCDEVTKTIELKHNTKVAINLEHHTKELDEVVITSFNNHKEAVSSVATTLNSQDITESTSMLIADVIEKVSGVSTFKTGNGISKPIIHGMHSSRVAIINNNSRLEDQDWGSEHDPNILMNNIDQISVIKGASTLEYSGSIIGGAIVLKPANPIKKDTLKGIANTYANSNGRGFGTNINIQKHTKNSLYFYGGGSFEKSGDFKSPDYYLSNTSFQRRGFSFIVGKKDFKQGWLIDYSFLNREIGILQAAHVSTDTDLFFAIKNGRPTKTQGFSYIIDTPKQDVTHHALKTSYFRRFKGIGKLSILYNYQQNKREEFDTRTGGRSNIPVIDLSLKTHQAKATFTIDKENDWTLKLGAEAQSQINFPSPNTGVKRLIPDYKKYDIGGFAIGHYSFNPNLILDLGIRYDYSHIKAQKFYRSVTWNRLFADDFSDFFRENIQGQTYTEPSFTYQNFSFHSGIWHQVNNHFDMRYSLGISQRNPNPAELFSEGLHQSAAAYEIGNLHLKQEKSFKLISELGWHLKNHEIKLSPFIQLVQDYIFQAPRGLRESIRGTFLQYEYDQTDAILSGIDLDSHLSILDKINIDSSISFVFAEDTDLNQPIIGIPPLNGIHNLQYQLTKKWSFGTTYRWSAKQHRVPNNNLIIDVFGKEETLDISTAPDSFHLIDLNSKYEIPVNKNKLQFIITAQNIFNKPYRSYLNRLRYFSDESGTNIQIKINYQF